MVDNIAPHFAYQLQFRSGELEDIVYTKEDIKRFLSALYGGRTDDRDVAFDAEYGVMLDRMDLVRPSPLLSEVVSSCFSLFCSICPWMMHANRSGTGILRQRVFEEWTSWAMYVPFHVLLGEGK